MWNTEALPLYPRDTGYGEGSLKLKSQVRLLIWGKLLNFLKFISPLIKWRHQSDPAIWRIEEIIAAKLGHLLPVAATVNHMNLMPSKEAIYSLISLEVKSSKRGVGRVTSLWKSLRRSSLPQSADDVSKRPLACVYLSFVAVASFLSLCSWCQESFCFHLLRTLLSGLWTHLKSTNMVLS